MKLPIGFRFRPTDEELLVHYLKRRVMSLPLPASVIPSIHIFNFDPFSLSGDLKEKRYYFCKRQGEFGNKFTKVIPTSSGFWKFSSKCKHILSSGDKNDVVGTRKTWRFYQVSSQPHRHCSKTRWLMHEFQLADSTQNETHDAGNWVVCRIFQRKMKHKNHGMVVPKCKCCDNEKVECNMGNDRQSSFDFKVETNFDLGPPQPSSPCSTTD
ncbi:hypothetical protein RND81_13G160200 [Saponaria officinalis]|uniref:NAC domain-containing protein n=1 Tax=Saponaria officinalis TaxID=3572 RepID=A0AAW1H1J2_SAPOF